MVILQLFFKVSLLEFVPKAFLCCPYKIDFVLHPIHGRVVE